MKRGRPPNRPVRPQRTMGIQRMTAVARPAVAPANAFLDAPDLSELYPSYQPQGVMWLRERKRALLADDMGLGKSIQSIRALPRQVRAIVVCPSSVRVQWKQVIERERGSVDALGRPNGPQGRPDLKVTLAKGLRRPEQNEVLIISQDSLPDPPPYSSLLILDNLSDVHLVIDECQSMQAEDAQRTMKFRKLQEQCGWVWGLSGTPMRGTPENYWGVLASLGIAHLAFDFLKMPDGSMLQGRQLFLHLCNGTPRMIRDKNRCNFHKESDCKPGCKGRITQRGYNWGEISPEVRRRLDPFVLRRLKRDVLPNLPPVTYQDVPVETPDDLRDYLNEVNHAWDTVDQTAVPPFELLAQATGALARARIPEAVDFARHLADSVGQILVFSAHVDPILAIGKIKGAAAYMGTEHTPERVRNKNEQDFKDGKVQILGLTIGAGGTALNLAMAKAILFVDRSWTPDDYFQAVARANRPGQEGTLMVYNMTSDHPIERRQSQLIAQKLGWIDQAVGL